MMIDNLLFSFPFLVLLQGVGKGNERTLLLTSVTSHLDLDPLSI